MDPVDSIAYGSVNANRTNTFLKITFFLKRSVLLFSFLLVIFDTHTTIVVIQSTPIPRDKCKTMKLLQRKPEI